MWVVIEELLTHLLFYQSTANRLQTSNSESSCHLVKLQNPLFLVFLQDPLWKYRIKLGSTRTLVSIIFYDRCDQSRYHQLHKQSCHCGRVLSRHQWILLKNLTSSSSIKPRLAPIKHCVAPVKRCVVPITHHVVPIKLSMAPIKLSISPIKLNLLPSKRHVVPIKVAWHP